MSLVTLTDVVKEFDGVRAVDGVSFSIDRGEVVGFLGPNGAGKTTAMRLITYNLQSDAGRVEIDGRQVEEDPRELRRRIGYLPETNPLYTEMLVTEYLDFVGRLRGLSRPELRRRKEAAVARTGIEAVYYRPIEHCSKGYRQRVGFAQAILTEPEILILDEPTEGLDPNQRVEIRNLIGRLGEERTVLLSTHVLPEVRKTCDRVLIIHRGRLIADGSVDALVARGTRGAQVTVELEAEPGTARAALERVSGVAGVAEEESAVGRRPRAVTGAADAVPRGRFRVTGAPGVDPRAAISALAAERGWPLWELHLERESLEDLFRELTGRDAEAGRGDGGGAPAERADDPGDEGGPAVEGAPAADEREGD